MTRPSMLRRPFLHTALCAALLLGAAAPAHAFFYDPFAEATDLRPHDELEQRVWDEADTLRSQWVRGRPGGALGLTG